MEPIILPRISDQKPLVSVLSLTYNHEPYIRDCLEGFLMQKTDFPVEFIIHDDASTDHTADILREYYENRPDLFHMIIERENCYSQCKPIMIHLCKKAQGKYIALCEGDDYWTDPLKLQKQFDFMETHQEYAMCYTNIETYNQKTRQKGEWILSDEHEIDFKKLMMRNTVHTLTSFFLREKINIYYFEVKKNIPRYALGDYPLWLWMSQNGKIYHSFQITGCYRILEESASHSKDKDKQYCFALDTLSIRLLFSRLYKYRRFYYFTKRIKYVLLSNIRERNFKRMIHDLIYSKTHGSLKS